MKMSITMTQNENDVGPIQIVFLSKRKMFFQIAELNVNESMAVDVVFVWLWDDDGDQTKTRICRLCRKRKTILFFGYSPWHGRGPGFRNGVAEIN